MSKQKQIQPDTEPGINLDKIGFDENGEVTGLDDEILGEVSGGLMNSETNINCPVCEWP